MNIIEAIKSGKNFKRSGTDYWEDTSKTLFPYGITAKALVADDWEVEGKTITITEFESKTVTITKS